MVFDGTRQLLRLAGMQVELESSFVAVFHVFAFQPSKPGSIPLLRNLG
jgi:hypothetical protein